MKLPRLRPALVAVALAFGGTSCQPGPDLIAVSLHEDQGPTGYCNRSDSGLTVTVNNQGTEDAQRSRIKVEFFPGGTFTADVFGPGQGGALPSGIAWDVQVPNTPPSACFDPDCQFQITVDSDAAIVESNETNNVVGGACIG